MAELPFGSGLGVALISLVTILLVSWGTFRKSSPYPLPPGPKGVPILGHMRIVPQENPHLYYQRLGKEYSK